MISLLPAFVVVMPVLLAHPDPVSPRPNVQPEILKVVYCDGKIVVCKKRTQEKLFALMAPLDEPTRAKELHVVNTDAGPRWTIRHGHFWVGESERIMGTDGYCRYQLADFFKQKLVTAPGAKEGAPLHDFGSADLRMFYFVSGMVDFRDSFALYFDDLPIGEDRVLTFALTNVRFRIIPPGKADNPAFAGTISVTDEEKKNPKWRMCLISHQPKWNGKEKDWESGKNHDEGHIEPLFHEAFQVVAKGDDYYFLTASGKVYVSKKPEKEKPRTMDTFWTDADQPIIAFVTDANKERTFVFTKNKKKDDKDVYFELAGKPDPKAYKLKKIDGVKIDEPLKSVLEYAHVLRDDKRLK
jgi:hypothetical protein